VEIRLLNAQCASELHAASGPLSLLLAEPQVKLKPVLITELDPAQITFEIETLVEKSLPVEIRISGEPAIGYESGNPVADPSTVDISGPASLINRVDSIIAEVDITGQRQDYSQRVQLRAIDENGVYLDAIKTDPGFAMVSAQIQQGERYRLVAVIPIINGQPDFGFRITKITVIPEQVIIFSSDPAVFDALPGFVETIPIDINGAKEPIEVRASLDLPDRTALVGDQNILVQVSIEAIENSMTITSPVEIRGLADDLYAVASPSSVTIFLTGPITTLEQLKPEDVRVVVDLFDKGEGTHQVTPQIIVPPTDVEGSALPAMIEVTITSVPPETQDLTEP